MSEISQKMGFDASAAITTLANLDKAMQALNASVTAAPAGFAAFNAKAGKTVSALKHLSSNSKTAATDLQKLLNLQGRVSTTTTGKAPTAAAAQPVKQPDLSPYIAQLQEMYRIAGTASKEQKRAFQSAITAAAEYAQRHKKTADDIASTNADMTRNMTGTANKLADALARISGKSKVTIPAPDASRYAAAIQKLIPLTQRATDAQKRSWLSLSTKIAESALKSGMSIKELIAVHGKLGQSLTGPANKIANDMQKMSSAGQKAVNGMTVSWQTMMRVMATQVIVRALSAIRRGLRSAVGDAVKFQRALAEIGTIGRELGSADDIGAMVQRVSNQFNVGLADTAEAAYQTVSNQIASTEADVESFLGVAAKFSKITRTDMATSVNLLSGVLNAFGKEVSQTEDVAAKFFKTIELGRTRAEELAQGYGTVAPIADKLGISMEELNASVATLTINGIKTDKAFTQIRGTMQGFLKPTVAMKSAMKELGFATGEQVLEAYNLQDAIKAVTETTEGNASAIAALFPRIRGLTGVLTLVNDTAGHFTRTLKEQKEALQDVYDKAYKLVIETDAEKLTKDLNKLKNFFTVGFGQAVLSATVQISTMIGGVDNLLLLFKAMGQTLPVVALGLGGIGIVLGALALKAKIAAASLTLLNVSFGIVAVIGAALVAFNLYNNYVDSMREKEIAAASAANDKITAENQLAIDKQIAAEKHRFDELVMYRAKELAEHRKEYQEKIDVVLDANTSLVTSTKWAVDGIVKSRLAAVEAIKSAAIEADEAVKKSRKSAIDMAKGLEDTMFQRGLDATKSDVEKLQKIMQRSTEESQRALKLMGSATTEQERTIALAAHKRAIALNQQAYALTKSSDNERSRLQVNADMESMTNRMIKAETKYGDRVDKTSASLKISARDGAAWAAALKESQDQISKLADQTRDGKFMSQSDMTANRKEMEKELEKFFKIVDIGVERFGADASPLVQKLVENLAISETELEVQTLLALPSNMSDIQQQVKASFEAFAEKDPARMKVEFYADKMGITVEDMASFNLASAGQMEEEGKFGKLRGDAATNMNEYADALGDVQAQLKAIESLPEIKLVQVSGTAFQVIDQTGIKINTLRKELAGFAQSGNVSVKFLDEWAASAQGITDSIPTGFIGFWGDFVGLGDRVGGEAKEVQGEINALTTAFGTLRKAMSLKEAGAKNILSTLANQSSQEVQAALATEAINKRVNATMIEQQKLSVSAGQQKAAAQKTVTMATNEGASAVGRLAQKYLASKTSADQAAISIKKVVTSSAEAGNKPFQNQFRDAKRGADLLIPSIEGINTKLRDSQGAQDEHTAAVGGTQSAVNNLIASYTQLLASIQAAASAQSMLSTGTVTAAKGGPIGYFASGGRGTDTIPAMLSAGEFVTNAKSSRRFFSQLQAMNAGRTPVYRESGGSTTNIGDVSISVTESSSPRQTGREVMQAFRREIRRGSGRI